MSKPTRPNGMPSLSNQDDYEAYCDALEAENGELTERWLTRSSEVDQLKTRCSEYQRKVAGMVQRQDYEDRCGRIAELEAEAQAFELNRVMDRQQIDVLKDDAASQQDRFLRCVKTRKDLADKCDKLEAENAELRKRQWQWVNAELSAKLTRAVELLRDATNICAKFGQWGVWGSIDAFLTEMEDTHD